MNHTLYDISYDSNLLSSVWTAVCFVVAWLLVVLCVANAIAFVRDVFDRAKTMHRIPCSRCKYFTNDYRLKCPVHPHQALSESAIGCQDFESFGE